MATNPLVQKRYMLTNLKYKNENWIKTEKWSLYLIDADYDILDVDKTSGQLVPKFAKFTKFFTVKKCLYGLNQIPRVITFSGLHMPEHKSYPLTEKGFQNLIKAAFNITR